MADSAEGAGFWLPSEFFDDFQAEKQNLLNNNTTESGYEFCFPAEFPYDSAAKSDELLQQRWLMSASPQSTLSHVSSWAGRSAGGFSSTLTTPEKDSAGDLICLAAGQVARLKLHGGHIAGPTKPEALMAPPRSLPTNIYHEQRRRMWQQMHQVKTGQEACPGHQSPTRVFGSGRAAVYGGGAAVRRGCAGTGVFLPRRYENNSNDCDAYSLDSRNRPGYAAHVHAINKNFENLNCFTQFQPRYQPKLGKGILLPEHVDVIRLVDGSEERLVAASSTEHAAQSFVSGELQRVPPSGVVDLLIRVHDLLPVAETRLLQHGRSVCS